MRKSFDQSLPASARRALRKLGEDMRDARLVRQISMAEMCERSFVSRSTLHKIERGDVSVAIGYYASVLFILQLEGRLGEVADLFSDELGLQLMQEKLPQRIRKSSKKKSD